MAVTIREVAEKCGLPISQVATLLNEYVSLEGDERRRVMEAARELGYPLKRRARTLNLGVLFTEESQSDLTHPFFSTVLNAFKAEAEARGYDITFINHNIGTEGASYLEHCRYRRVDGVLLACVNFYSQEVQELLSSEIPCAAVDYVYPGQTCVVSDNRSGVRQLVDYAVEQGHRRIAFIHGQRNSQVTEDRIEEFRSAMANRHLPIPPEYLTEGRYGEIEAVRGVVEALLKLPERPTCILLPDDATYLGAQEVIREAELRIPSDVSVAGYDGIHLTQSLRPHLTTIRQHSEVIGAEAARQLIERIENGAPAREAAVIPVTLLRGETLGWCNAW